MFDPKKLSDFPSLSGVYLMKASDGEVLYVGKAKNIRNRVRQYFVLGGDGRFMVPYLIKHVDKIETIVVSSEKEALLLENTLIKKYQPRYNALLKDDKTFIALKITTRHPWPRCEVVRLKGKPKHDGQYFGPYTSAYAARQTLELLHKVFPLRQCSDQELLRRTRPCILYDMKRCIAPCVNLCTKEEYNNYVESTSKFLKGQRKDVLKSLYLEMEKASDALEFERAEAIYNSIQQIEKSLEVQKVDKPFGGDYDVLAIFRQGDEVVLSQLIVREGKLIGSNHNNFSQIAEEDPELLSSFILQQYQNKEDCPKEILLPLVLEDKDALEEVLDINLFFPQRGEKKEMVEMALLNAQAHFKKEKDEESLREKSLLDLQEKLKLTHYPSLIECIDNSSLSSSEPVSAVIAFKEGQKDTSRYRKFKIKEASLSDDYGMMCEVLTRRYRKAKEENDLPDLLIIDGGKGHLNIARKVLESLDIASVDLIGLAKEEGRHDRGVTQEQIFLLDVKDPIILPKHSSALHLLQRIRDEAHRSAITYQKKRRTKALIKSLLDDVPGIGPAKRKALLIFFGSVQKVSEASPEELAKVKGINKKDISTLLAFFIGK